MKRHKEIFAHQVMHVPRINTKGEKREMAHLKRKAIAASTVGAVAEIHANDMAYERHKQFGVRPSRGEYTANATSIGAKSLASTYSSTIKDIELQGYKRGLGRSGNKKLKSGKLYKSAWTSRPIVKTRSGEKIKLSEKPISDRRRRKNARWQAKRKAGGSLPYYQRKLRSGKTVRVKKGKRR